MQGSKRIMEAIPFKRVREFFEKYEYGRYIGCSSFHFILLSIIYGLSKIIKLEAYTAVFLLFFAYYFGLQTLGYLFLFVAEIYHGLEVWLKELINKLLSRFTESKSFMALMKYFRNFVYNYIILIYSFIALGIIKLLDVDIIHKSKMTDPTLSDNSVIFAFTYVSTMSLVLLLIVIRKLPCLDIEIHRVFLEKNKGLIFTFIIMITIFITMHEMNVLKFPDFSAIIIITSIIYMLLPIFVSALKGALKKLISQLKKLIKKLLKNNQN